MSNRPDKRSIRHASNIARQRINIANDFEVIKARTSSLHGPGKLPLDTPRSPLKGRTTWLIGEDWSPDDDLEASLDPNSNQYDMEMASSMADVMKKMRKDARVKGKKRSQASARPNVFWKKNHRDDYLDELIRSDGRGDFQTATNCPDCVARGVSSPLTPEYRCTECFTPDLTCAKCCIRRHARQPFHRVERWAGAFFVPTSLKELGLTIHLNHSGLVCPSPKPVDERFLVLHTNGIHTVSISYCGCAREIPGHLQLLRRGLYPASQQNVRTCATFSLLRLAHSLSLTAKMSTYDLYRALEILTPGSTVKRPKSRYRPLLRMLTQWRHLKLLKRGGRGNDPSGVFGTKDGELALLCPSCPHPEINLDDNWMDVPNELRFLYALFICMDANFRLKSALVSNYSNDPGLGIGMAYMLPLAAYEEYVRSQADEEDINTCVGFQALAKATTRNSRGLRYTGVAAVVCARSEMVLPNAVGNLQKGERYANVDYVFASAIQHTYLLIVAISYDIVCQWFVNLFKRTMKWPPALKLRPGLHLRPFIPKFHAPAHKEEDHEQYSLNLAEGAGMTDGEAIERVWGPHNALANSTKISGPGTRQDILDDNFAFWNFLKYISMGSTLMRRYKASILERNLQVEAHRGFTNSLPPAVAAEWEQACVRWNDDGFPKTEPNPYRVEGADVSDNAARQELEQAEVDARQAGDPLRHETSAVSFIWMGLELEESQRRVKELAAELSAVPTNLQTSALKDQQALLRNRMQGWEQIRSVYMPGLLQYLTDIGANPGSVWDTDPNPEQVALWLPSAVPSNRRRAACSEGLPSVELKLRTSQCASSLQDLRQVLRLKTRMVYWKLKNIRGQRDGTRSRAVIDRVHKRAIRFVHKYRAAREAKLALEGPGPWEAVYQVLKNDDVRSYADGRKKRGPGRKGIWEDGQGPPERGDEEMLAPEEDDASDIEMGDISMQTDAQRQKARKKGTGETRKELSWIWRSFSMDVGGEDADGDRILKAEWARSRARSLRAKEEALLLREEMRRVLRFLEWSERGWYARASKRTVSSAALEEGIQAYALKQSALQRALHDSFSATWKTPLEDVDDGELDATAAAADAHAQAPNDADDIDDEDDIEEGDEIDSNEVDSEDGEDSNEDSDSEHGGEDVDGDDGNQQTNISRDNAQGRRGGNR